MATTSETQAEVGQDAGHANFPPFDVSTFPSQILWFALAFGAMYYYLSRRYLPAVGGVIKARRERIARDIDEATAMQSQAEAAAAEHEKAIEAARLDAQTTANAARAHVAAQSDARRKALEHDLAAKLAEAERSIAASRASAMENVATIARDATGAVVERLIGRAPDRKAVERAVKASAET